MGRTRIGFRLSEEQKERWQEHAEGSRYDDTLSDLVKRAVEAQIDRDEGNGDAAPARDGASGQRVDELLADVGELKNAVDGLAEDVGEALTAVYGQNGVDQDVLNFVFSTIPEGKGNAAPAEEIAAELDHPARDVDTPTVRLACHILENSTNAVDHVSRHDEARDVELAHWYVTGGR